MHVTTTGYLAIPMPHLDSEIQKDLHCSSLCSPGLFLNTQTTHKTGKLVISNEMHTGYKI